MENVAAERRKEERFELKAWITTEIRCQNKKRIGVIVDVSRGGMALRSPNGIDEMKDPCELNIICSAENFRLMGIPARVVSNTDISDVMSFSLMSMRRLGIQFGELTAEQLDKLDYMIRNFSFAEA